MSINLSILDFKRKTLLYRRIGGAPINLSILDFKRDNYNILGAKCDL